MNWLILLFLCFISTIESQDSELRRKKGQNFSPFTSKQVYQRCIAPGNRPGHCRHIRHCPVVEFKGDRLKFMDYFCIIRRTYVGVCCPDDFTFTVPSNDQGQASFPSFGDFQQQEVEDEFDEIIPLPNTPKPSGIKTTPKPLGIKTTVKPGTNKEEDEVPFEIKGCGITENHETRITGGVAAKPKEWPWMAALLKKGIGHFCGGCIVTDKHILTAAHCVHGIKSVEITVRLGEYNFSADFETRHHDFGVSKMIIHKDYSPSNYENDISLMVLGRKMMFNSYIWPICLPQPGELFENNMAFVTGWGTIYYGGPVSKVLMQVTIPIWNNTQCEDKYVQPILDTHLCAGDLKGGKDACQGDSGGPLLLQLPNKRWIAIGVVSWGIGCGDEGRPGVYTRVNKYLDWLLENTVA